VSVELVAADEDGRSTSWWRGWRAQPVTDQHQQWHQGPGRLCTRLNAGARHDHRILGTLWQTTGWAEPYELALWRVETRMITRHPRLDLAVQYSQPSGSSWQVLSGLVYLPLATYQHLIVLFLWNSLLDGTSWTGRMFNAWLTHSTMLPCSLPRPSQWRLVAGFAKCFMQITLDNEAVRVACVSLWITHQCKYGVQVDTRGIHSLVCEQELGKASRHHNLEWCGCCSCFPQPAFLLPNGYLVCVALTVNALTGWLWSHEKLAWILVVRDVKPLSH